MISSFFSFLYRSNEDEIIEHNKSNSEHFTITTSGSSSTPQIDSNSSSKNQNSFQSSPNDKHPSYTFHIEQKIHANISDSLSSLSIEQFDGITTYGNVLNEVEKASIINISKSTSTDNKSNKVIVPIDDINVKRENQNSITDLTVTNKHEYRVDDESCLNQTSETGPNKKIDPNPKILRGAISIKELFKESEDKLSIQKLKNLEKSPSNREHLSHKGSRRNKQCIGSKNKRIDSVTVKGKEASNPFHLSKISKPNISQNSSDTKLRKRPQNPLSHSESLPPEEISISSDENSATLSPSYVNKIDKPDLFKSIVNDIYKNDELKPGTIVKNRYKVTTNGVIGSGSFGVIYEVEYLQTKMKYALKIIPPKYKQQAKSEREFLLQFTNYEGNHVIRFLESFIWRGKVCLIFELLSSSLYDMLQLTKFKGLKLKIVQIIGRQVIASLQYLACLGIIHCDIKPENILLCPIKERHFKEEHLRIKLIDFGSACHFQKGPFIKYIQSRFYRAPEIMLEQKYSFEIDIWSLGCLLFELHTGLPLFDGESETEMISKIVATIGMPPQSMIQTSPKSSRWFNFNPDIGEYVLKEELMLPRHTLREKLGLDTEDGSLRLWKGKGYKKRYYDLFYDLLSQILRWDPRKRLNWDQLLEHSFFTQTFDQTDT